MAGSEGQEAPKSKKPKDSPFTQQRLDAWQPILLPKNVVVVFAILGACFLGFGIWMIAESNSVVEYVQQYDGSGTPTSANDCKLISDTTSTCMVSFNVKEEMKQPVFLYYQLENFYQNHRRYVKSRSDAQLRGDDVEESALSDCEPLVTNSTGAVRNPCGLIAASMFNDTFTVTTGQAMREDNIAWESDKKSKFKNNAAFPASKDIFWLNYMFPGLYNGALDQEGVTNEHFIVWMRTAALPNFRKLYGRFETSIPKDTVVSFNVTTRFRIDLFDGKKSLVLSTTSAFGGKNPFLGIAYIVVASLCFLLAAVFGIKQCLCPRELGSAGSLNWK